MMDSSCLHLYFSNEFALFYQLYILVHPKLPWNIEGTRRMRKRA